jgi:ABC-type polysaccharide/polyol phosphate transport system ATPase subunit
MNAITIRGLKKTFVTKKESAGLKDLFSKREKFVRDVIDNIDLDIKKGEVFGIVGRNGSGKSTLLKMISKIMEPDSGTIEINGNVASILELGMGFHQDLSGRENIRLKGSMYGFSKKELDDRIETIIDYAELGEYIDLPLRVYSTGMASRLAFALMVNVDADILVVDEVLSTGDAAFSMKAGAHFRNMKKLGKTILYVSHSIGTVESMCDRVAWLDNGKIREIGNPKTVCGHYLQETTESFDVVKEAAEAGTTASQNILGIMYRDGYKTDKNETEAKKWFSVAADGGDVSAMVNLADLLMKEEYKDEERIIDLYSLAADRGNKDAKNKLSRLLSTDRNMSMETVKKLFENLLSDDFPHLYHEYATFLKNTAWDNEDRKNALKWFKKASEFNIAESEYQIAIMYRDGTGPVKNNEEYVSWLTKSAEHGRVGSQFDLGNLYSDGIKVVKNDNTAFKWYLMAAKNGNADAQYRVAMMYREGRGVEKNIEESKKWFSIQPDTTISRQLGILADSYLNGKHMVHDEITGVELYKRLASSGNSDAKYVLGRYYLDSVFTDNPEKAVNLLKSSMEQKNVKAAGAILNLYKHGLCDKSICLEALHTLETLAKMGNVSATERLGSAYADGIGVPVDFNKGMKNLGIGAASGNNPWTAMRVANTYRLGLLGLQNFKLAAKYYLIASSRDIYQGSYPLVEMYASGVADRDVFDLAIRDLHRMAALGNSNAMRLLGNIYNNGIGVKTNSELAHSWYIRAANFGDVSSINRVGNSLESSNDPENARKWFLKGVKKNEISSIDEMLKRIKAGKAEKEDLNLVLERLEILAAGGIATASRILGIIYMNDDYSIKNIEESKKWFKKAISLGDLNSKNRLKALEK